MFCVVRIVGQFCPELSRHCLVSDFGRELLRIAEVDRVLFVFGIYLCFSISTMSNYHPSISTVWPRLHLHEGIESTADLFVGHSVFLAGDDVVEPSLVSHRGHFD